MGGRTIRGFNDNTVRGYPLRLPLTTRQVTDVVMYDEDILRVKGGRRVPDNTAAILDPEVRREAFRKTCALRYLDGYPDTKVVDPIKENYPAQYNAPVKHLTDPCHTRDHAQCTVCASIHSTLDQASLSTNSGLLALSNNGLYQSLSGPLKGASSCDLIREPIPVWNLVRVLRTKPDAELVRQTTALMDGDGGISINMPSAPMPTPGGKRRLHVDPVNSARLGMMDRV